MKDAKMHAPQGWCQLSAQPTKRTKRRPKGLTTPQTAPFLLPPAVEEPASPPLLAEAFKLHLPRSNQPSPTLHSRRRPKWYCEGMVHDPRQRCSASFALVQSTIRSSLLSMSTRSSIPINNFRRAACKNLVPKSTDPIDLHLSVRPCLL